MCPARRHEGMHRQRVLLRGAGDIDVKDTYPKKGLIADPYTRCVQERVVLGLRNSPVR